MHCHEGGMGIGRGFISELLSLSLANPAVQSSSPAITTVDSDSFRRGE
jgi:hypothetical protein